MTDDRQRKFIFTATRSIAALRVTTAAVAAGSSAAAAGGRRAGAVAAVAGEGPPALRPVGRACVGAEPRGWGAVVAVGAAAHAHDLGVDGRADAVVHLAVDLGQRVACAQPHPTLLRSAQYFSLSTCTKHESYHTVIRNFLSCSKCRLGASLQALKGFSGRCHGASHVGYFIVTGDNRQAHAKETRCWAPPTSIMWETSSVHPPRQVAARVCHLSLAGGAAHHGFGLLPVSLLTV